MWFFPVLILIIIMFFNDKLVAIFNFIKLTHTLLKTMIGLAANWLSNTRIMKILQQTWIDHSNYVMGVLHIMFWFICRYILSLLPKKSDICSTAQDLCFDFKGFFVSMLLLYFALNLILVFVPKKIILTA